MNRFFLAFFAFSLLTSCVSLNTVSLTSIPVQRDHPVDASTSKFIFLGFNFDNDYVDEMNNQLKAQCPDGVISGILTKDEIVDYFLMIFWTHRVKATGYCNKSRVASGAPNRERHPSSLSSPANADEDAADGGKLQ